MTVEAVAGGLDGEPEDILIAVDPNLFDRLLVAAGFALLPKLFARSAPIMGKPRRQRLDESFLVHPSEHDDFTRTHICDDSRHQTVRAKTRTEFCRCFEIMRMAGGSQIRLAG